MLEDLHWARDQMRAGITDSAAQMRLSIAAARGPHCQHAFLTTTFDDAQAVANSADLQMRPLAGLAVSVKDLFDVAGQSTCAGSLALAQAPVAAQDCVAVARLRRAGAAFIGRTNMTEFAFSAVGVNPHFGTPPNAGDEVVDRVPGGSSSGAAVSVARGAAFIGLGSDTGGSIRIPAALNGIVGFKNTARLVPTTGAVPLSTTLDTVCALTRSVRDAILAHEILAWRQVTRSAAPLSAYRLAVANTLLLDGLDATVSAAWQRSLGALRRAGARIEEIALPQLNELAQIQATGGFSAPESYAWHKTMIAQMASSYDPRVLARIERGAAMSACEYLELVRARAAWIGSMTLAMQGFDAFLSPTVPLVAPPLSDVTPGAERDEAFFRLNAQLLRNPSMVNMLDGCAISIPCHQRGELPVGLMVWAGAMRDDTVLNVALQIENILQK